MDEKQRAKKDTPIRARHSILRFILGPVVWLLCKLYIPKLKIYGLKDKSRPYLFLYNHVTAFDQFFVSLASPRPLYHVASEDIFTNGILSKLMIWATGPIPIKKQMTDASAIKTLTKTAKAGGSIALSPEGNRSFDGRGVYINPAIAKLIKLLKLPIAIFKIEGGYGAWPRWSDKTRRGPVTCKVDYIIEPDEYKSMSADELFAVIKDKLYIDESICKDDYKGKNLAEFIERLFYVCPDCGFSEFESKGDVARCKACGLEVSVKGNGELSSKPFEPKSIAQWYDLQNAFVNKCDVTTLTESPVFTDKGDFFKVVPYKKKEMLFEGAKLLLFGDRIEVKSSDEVLCTIDFNDTEVVTVLGRNKLNIYTKEDVYQIKSEKRFNAVKYMNMFYRFKNQTGGNESGEFLGL